MTYPGQFIKMGSTLGFAVKEIKGQLNKLGYAKLDVNDANFGPLTEEAVKVFQEKNQLVNDGIVGRLTWDRLFAARIIVQPSSNVLRIRALEVAKTQLGVREKTGHNDGTEVKAYLKAVGLGEGFAWCMAFLYWSFQKASTDLGRLNPVPRTGGVLECLRLAAISGASIIYDASQVMAGDQFIMDFGGGKGHTGIVEDRKLSHLWSVEGNTNVEGSREGDGVYERSRNGDNSSFKAFIRYV